jgi:hypothetical protein
MSSIFLSHAWVDQTAARVAVNPLRGLAPLLRDHLSAAGLSVFFDAEEIRELDEIERRIRDGLAASTLFVCWYSDAYRQRRACHWELTAALTGDAGRVVVVNPEPGVDHVLPATLLGSRIPAAPDEHDVAGWRQLAERIAERARALPGTFGDLAVPEATAWYGDPPARFAHFVGRAEPLWQLDSLLRPPPAASGGERPPEAVVVHGLGGVGKTALVCEYATRFGSAYRGGVFWLRAGPGGWDRSLLRSRLDSQLLVIAEQLQSTPAPPDAQAPVRSAASARVLLRRLLDASPQPFLWVVDDLPPGLTTAEFREWLPPSRNGRTVVTSQGAAYRHVPDLALGLMPPDEAVELLFAAAPAALEPFRESGLTLAGRLEYLPLALEAVGALTALPGASPDRLLLELDQPADLVEEAAGNPYLSTSTTEHPASLAATFGPSISRLDPGSFWFLATAAALNVGPLPVEVIGPVAQWAANSAMPSRAALGMLLSRSLARRVDEETFEIHGLVAGAALRFVDRTDFAAACASRAAGRVCEVVGDANDIQTHRQSRRATEFGHALMAGWSRLDDTVNELGLLRYLGRYFHTERRYREAVALEERAATLATRMLGEDSEYTITVRMDHALSMAHSGGAAEAVEIIKNAAERLERVRGPDDMNVLTGKHNLAIQMFPIDPQEARRLGLEVYERRVRVFGIEHPHSLFSLHTLLSQDVVPQPYPDAVAAYEHLVELRGQVSGADHTTTLTSVHNFVDRLIRIGAFDRAVPMARRLLARRAELYGPDHDATLSARIILLTALTGLATPPTEEIAEIAATVSVATAGQVEDRQRRVMALSNGAEALRKAGDVNSAITMLLTARHLATEAPGVPTRIKLLVEHNHAAALSDSGDLAGALARYADLVPTMQRELGPTDRLTLRARRRQAITLAQSGSASQALDEHVALAEHWRDTAGPQSPELAEALTDVADTLDRLGRRAEADHYRALRRETGVDANAKPGYV